MDATKRLFDAVFAAFGLLVASPLFILLAVAIKWCDRGPIFYRQTRVGLHGAPFEILKFRTMVTNADKLGPGVTKDRDPRITPVGRLLRKTKLDELPQLWNVLRGEMSFVGPRPELPRYVALYTQREQPVLHLKPGITDLASLSFRNEEDLLRNAEDVEAFYMNVCVPKKAQLNLEYARTANFASDAILIFRTVIPGTIRVFLSYAAVLLFASLAAALLMSHSVTEAFRLAGPTLIWIVPIQLAFLAIWKVNRNLPEIFAAAEIREIGAAMATSGLLALCLSVTAPENLAPPIGTTLAHSVLSFAAVVSFRMFQSLNRRPSIPKFRISPANRIGIVGATSTGAQIAADLAANGAVVKVFFDDDPAKWNKLIRGVPVAGMPESVETNWRDELDEVVIAVPGVSEERLNQLTCLLQRVGMKIVIPAWLTGSHR